MNFADAVRNDAITTFTENGAKAISSTNSALLDLFGSIGSLREADPNRIERLFADAYTEDKLLATKILFYARDVRCGLGERSTFRRLLKYVANKHPEAVISNIPLIGLYGRYDDLYELIDTPVESKMWEYVKQQLARDIENMVNENHSVSLLAKWLKTADASSKKTRALGIYTAEHLDMSVYDYKRTIRRLRKYLDVTEIKMSANQWSDIKYAGVPSKAMALYKKAFIKHDAERFGEFISNVTTGKEKINASTLYPYDLIEAYLKYNANDLWGGFNPWSGFDINTEDPVIEAQWKALPNYVNNGANAIVIADTSGSMDGRPINSAVGLAIYFAERNTGAYHNLWMSFSRHSTIQILRGETLMQKINSIDTAHWDCNTNLEQAFDNLLDIAIRNNVPAEEMVKSIIVISDMEIDACSKDDWLFYDLMKAKYAQRGYEIPNIVFWNVNSRHDIFHADKNRKGVQLCSGQSVSTFKHLLNSIGLTPMEMMFNVLNSDRYAPVTISE